MEKVFSKETVSKFPMTSYPKEDESKEVEPLINEEEDTTVVDIIDLEYKPLNKHSFSLKPSNTGIILSMVAHLLAFLLPCTVAYYALTDFGLFSWHPIGMVLTFSFLMTEALLVFSKESSLVVSADRKSKLTYHGYALFCSLIIAFASFAAIFYNKYRYAKEHFTSWHGLMGVILLSYMSIQVAAGVALKYASEGAFRLPGGITLGIAKLLHSVSGSFLYLFGCVELLLGLGSDWFQSSAHPYVQGACWVAVVLLAAIAMANLISILQEKLPKKLMKRKAQTN